MTIETKITTAVRATRNSHYQDQNGNPVGGYSTGIGFAIAWQDGPIKEAGGRNGAFVEEVMESVISRLHAFQATPFKHDANDKAINHLRAAIAVLDERTADRRRRGVEGRNIQ